MFEKGYIPWNKGKKTPLVIKIKQSENSAKYWLGKRLSEETKKKISISRKGKASNKGKHWKLSDEARANITSGLLKRWAKIPKKKYKRYIHTRDSKYLKWRSDVFKRDRWTCQTCGLRGCYLEAHHIFSWAKYPKLRYSLENGVTLCLECHKLTNNYKNKKNEYPQN